MNYILTSSASFKLKNNQIKSICFLKDKEWKHGIKSQMKWYKKNIKQNDIHNMLYINSKLVGYTVLRKKKCEIEGLKKRINYFLLDTLLIDKEYRNKRFANLLMNFNNTIINQSGYFSFLNCEKNLVNFYKKNKWIKLDSKKIKVMGRLFSSNGMTFSKKYANKKKFCFYINK